MSCGAGTRAALAGAGPCVLEPAASCKRGSHDQEWPRRTVLDERVQGRAGLGLRPPGEGMLPAAAVDMHGARLESAKHQRKRNSVGMLQRRSQRARQTPSPPLQVGLVSDRHRTASRVVQSQRVSETAQDASVGTFTLVGSSAHVHERGDTQLVDLSCSKQTPPRRHSTDHSQQIIKGTGSQLPGD